MGSGVLKVSSVDCSWSSKTASFNSRPKMRKHVGSILVPPVNNAKLVIELDADIISDFIADNDGEICLALHSDDNLSDLRVSRIGGKATVPFMKVRSIVSASTSSLSE